MFHLDLQPIPFPSEAFAVDSTKFGASLAFPLQYLPDLPGHGRAFGADSGGVASTTAAGAAGGCHRRSDEVRLMLDGEVGWEVR